MDMAKISCRNEQLEALFGFPCKLELKGNTTVTTKNLH